MTRRTRAQTSGLFLLELILAILFFSIASAVCVQIFVRSRLMSDEAQALSHAVSECSGCAEVVSSAGGVEDALTRLQELYPKGSYDAQSGQIYYDEENSPCEKENAVSVLTIQISQDAQMLAAEIRMDDLGEAAEDPIYELTVRHHIRIGKEAGHE